MGVATGGKRAVRDEGPKCPPSMLSTLDKYREIKFTRRVTDDAIRLFARDNLSWQDLVAYSQMTGVKLSIHEVELIMGLDAIYEDRDNV